MARISKNIPALNKKGGDSSKQWFVYFNAIDKKTGIKKRYKYYISNKLCVRKRENAANSLISELSEKINRGWTPSDDINYISIIAKNKLAQIKPLDYSIEWHLNNVLKRRENNMRKKAFQTYLSTVREFIRFLKFKGIDKAISKLNTDDIIQFGKWLIDNKRSNTTYNKDMATLRSLFNDLVTDKLMFENPVKIKKLKEDRQGKSPFKEHQVKLLKDYFFANDTQMYLAIQLLYYCYIRPGELRLLKVRDF